MSIWSALGRLKSDLNFSISFTYNTFPLAEISTSNRQAVVECALSLEKVRNELGGSLAGLYNPLAMPASLVKAHQTLDRAVDKAFGTSARLEAADDRLRILFRAYTKLTSQEALV